MKEYVSMISTPWRFSSLLPSSNRGREAVYLLLGTVVFTLGTLAIGWLLYTPTRNLPLLLSTLAGAQAAFFGIVFAITVLGIQLATDRYSPRLVFLFIDDWPFRLTFGVFVASIGLDLFLLSQVSSTPSRLLAAGVAATGGLALASTFILYWFVRSTLAQSTPEGLIDAIADDLPPSNYLGATTTAERNDEPHPLHRLYSLTMAALSQGESETAYRGVETIDEVATDGLEEIQTYENDIDDAEIETAFATVQEEYLPEIALHAYEKEERRTATRTVDALDELGRTGLKGDTESVTRYSSEGLSEIIDETPLVVDGNTLRNSAAESLGDLLMDS
ncbi:DUF2254 family protein, partial [Natrinema sp. H-ect4]|uniref:DUF2254 family protein n=1 Tax=Natrinema sp. H-ect4 TaxID=3242699 RepID=UPI0035A9AA92